MLSSTSAKNVIGGKQSMGLTDTTIPKKDSKNAVIAQKGHPLITVSSLKDEERTRVINYSRVMGYHSPTHLWNTGKKGEWDDRRSKYFKLPKEFQQ
jgi:hypothetical protein